MIDKSGKARSRTGRDNAFRSDPEILDLIRDGDTHAFEEIVLKYQDRLYNLCRYMTGSAREAEDITQDTFIKAYRNLGKFREGSFSSWLYRIAVNGCLDYRRRPVLEPLNRTSKDGNEYSIEPRSDTHTPEESFQLKQASLAVEKGLSSLSDKLKAVIVLVEIDGLTYEEVAEVLGTSVGTVKSRLSRAREELRRRLRRLMEQK